MRYFTRGLVNGELSEVEEAAAEESYARRIAEISLALTPDLVWLASGPLHAAIIERVTWHPEQQRLRLELVAGDQGVGYQSVILTYDGVQIGDAQLATLGDLVRDRETEVLYTEIDEDSDGLTVHRFLFWPRDELTISFKAVGVTRRDRPDGRVELKGGLLLDE
jgi:hypothetical protein